MQTQFSIYKVGRIGVTFGQARSTAGPICWQEFTFYDQEGEPIGRVVAHLEGPAAALSIGPWNLPPRP
jgi:hypothetical protein